MKKIIKYIFLPVFIIALGYFSMIFLSLRSADNKTGETVATISNENAETGKILGEEGSASSADASRMFASDNFRSPQISFGGDAIAVPSGEQAVAPQIANLKSELLMAKSDQKVKFNLSWMTNKPCLSSIDFKKDGEAQGKIVSEDGYGYIHSVTLTPLNFSTTYSYAVTAKDRWGNVAESDRLAFYTGAPNVSIFDLLGNAFKDMFGRTGK